MKTHTVTGDLLFKNQICISQGITTHRGVCVIWSHSGPDDRVFDVLNEMPAILLEAIVMVYPHKGSMTVFTKTHIDCLDDGVDCYDGDWWNVEQIVLEGRTSISAWDCWNED